jgi:hypothetical protein
MRRTRLQAVEKVPARVDLQQHPLHAKPSEIAKFSCIFAGSSLQRV